MTTDAASRNLNKQQLRTKTSTDLLLKAASEILVEEGITALTLVNVGERAGYSRGLVTTRFGSKENMLRALVERMTTGWAAAHVEPRTTGKSGLESLLELMRVMRDQTARKPSTVLALQALLFDSINPASSARPPILEYNASLRRAIELHIATGIADKTIRDGVDAKREASWVLEALRGIGFNWLLTPNDYDAVSALTHTIQVVENRFSPQ